MKIYLARPEELGSPNLLSKGWSSRLDYIMILNKHYSRWDEDNGEKIHYLVSLCLKINPLSRSCLLWVECFGRVGWKFKIFSPFFLFFLLPIRFFFFWINFSPLVLFQKQLHIKFLVDSNSKGQRGNGSLIKSFSWVMARI